jgi:serine/threonine protein kinase
MQLLGKGGFGEVVALDAERVAKIQRSSREYDPGVSCAVLREILAMGVVDKGRRLGRVLLEDDGTCAMEIRRYDETLLEYIRRQRGKLDGVAERLSIFSDIVQELHTVHSMSIAHRDLKPENVMLKKGRAHIIDWGMSRVMNLGADEWNAWTPGVTTVWYRAPELFTGEEYGLAVDVWSLGILLIELMTGTCPFRGRTEVLQIKEYIEVLGLPTKGALKRWPYEEVALGCEPERTKLWNAMPAIARVQGLAQIIDRMVRWDMRQRITTEELITSMRALHIGSVQTFHPTTSSPDPYASMRPSREPALLPQAARALRSIIFPLCARWKLNEAVLWVAICVFNRVSAKTKFRSKAQFTLNAIACLDIANKLVGSQDVMVLRRLNIEDGRHAQVNIVNHCLGIQGIRPVVFNCPPILVNAGLGFADPCRPSIFTRAFVDSLIFGNAWTRIEPKQWVGLGHAFQHLVKFVVSGQMVHYKRFLKCMTGLLRRKVWRRIADDIFTHVLEETPPVLKAAHPRVFRMIKKDKSLRHRLEFILST